MEGAREVLGVRKENLLIVRFLIFKPLNGPYQQPTSENIYNSKLKNPIPKNE